MTSNLNKKKQEKKNSLITILLFVEITGYYYISKNFYLQLYIYFDEKS